MKSPYIALYLILLFTFPLQAAEYRIGYMEAGPSAIYDNTFSAIQKALDEMGWGNKIEFVKDARFSPGWSPEERKTWEQTAEKLIAYPDLDLIFSAGTDATSLLLKADKGKVPIVAGAVSDAVKSGFVLNEEDSGRDNFTVRIVPGRYKRMFKIFHDEVAFKKLGLLYVDSENGKKYANVSDAEEIAAERGFQIIHYKINESLTPEECMTALKTLVKKGIDAFYIPSLTCFEWEKYDVKEYLTYLMEHKIPSFARQGSQDVKAGALMGFSTVNYSERGRFLADKIIRILEGNKPRNLKMVDKAPPKIALNLYVAQKLGFEPSFDILGASDEIYQEITLPEKRLLK